MPRGVYPRPTPASRFWAKVRREESGCWTWTASTNWGGYGQFTTGGKGNGAHVFAYKLLVGPIPEGLHLDHKCRNRACVNPAHLEPVTPAENCRRAAALKTHCKHGHEFTPENTRRKGRSRLCITCRRRSGRETEWRRRHPDGITTTFATCRTCGSEFEQGRRGRPRLHCTECTPPKATI